MVNSGGTQVVPYGPGVASGTVISSGAIQVVSGGTAADTVVSSGAVQVVSGGWTDGTDVSSGGTVLVSGGSTAYTVVNSGGSEVVYSEGVADWTNLEGGTLMVFGGAAGDIISDGGIENVGSGGSASYATVSNGGIEYIGSGGSATSATVSSGGIAYVGSGGMAAETVVRSGGMLEVTSGAIVSQTILWPGGQIDLVDFAYDSSGVASFNTAAHTLTISAGGQTETLSLAGDYSHGLFHLVQDGGGGTIVSVEGTPCYCRGTRILTDRGEVAVEDLRIGDRLLTLAGAMRPIRWIGRRSYAGRFAAGNRDVLPVLFRTGALADGVPRRDLFVSPLHAMYLDGVLIPASALVNGDTIVQMEAVDRVDYFHLELETHDVILAEGAPSETFVDDDSRGMFHNAAEYRLLYPDAGHAPARYCAPRVEEGEALEAVRRRLAERARPDMAAVPRPGRLTGCVDLAGLDRIAGWAHDEATPDRPVRLRILDNEVVIGEVLADRFRPDLEQAGIGDGRHCFEFGILGGLSPLVRHVIRVQRVADGQDLPNSPWVLEPAPITLTAASMPAAPLYGCIDEATRERITGWAQDGADPEAPVALQVLDNGMPIARVLANRHRGDLARRGIGCGWHCFDLVIPGGLSPLARHVIQVRRETDGAELPGSPVVIAPADSFDAGLEQAVSSAVAALGAAPEGERVLSFLLAQADQLRQQHADAETGRTERLLWQRLRRRSGAAADEAEPNRRALVVDERVPVAGRDAGSQAILSHMRALRRLGYGVSFVAARELAADEAAVAALEAEGVACCRAPFYTSVEEVLRRQGKDCDLVYLHRVDVATRYLALARQHMPRARILYGVADLHHLRLERQASVEGRPDLLAESRRKRFEEFVAAHSADAVITHSADEAMILRQAVPGAAVSCVPWHVPARPVSAPFAAVHGVAFIGGYAHAPNVDAAHWLVEAVMPLVWRQAPDIECLLVGSDMPESVRELAGPGVAVLGHVPDLAAGVFGRVRLTVAPLRYGAGVKGKVLESLAAGRPCAMTPVAAEGLGLPEALQACVGADANALAAVIRRLHQDEAAHREAAEAGLRLVRENHAEATVSAALQAAIEGGVKQVAVSR